MAPPPPERSSFREIAGRRLLGLTIVAALVGSLVIGMPALSLDHSAQTQQSLASQDRWPPSGPPKVVRGDTAG